MANDYVPLATITLTSAQTQVTFASIPATYRDLVVVVAWRNSGTASASRLQLNSDGGSNYTNVSLVGNSTAVAAGVESGTSMRVFGSSLGPTTSQQSGFIYIMDYSATNKHKTALVRHSDAFGDVHAISGRWASTAAVNTVRVFDVLGQTYQVGATFSLYGIRS